MADGHRTGREIMKKIILLIVVLPCLLIACSNVAEPQSPEPAAPTIAASITETSAAAPSTSPVSTSNTPTTPSAALMARLWDKVPDTLPQGYQKSSLYPETGTAVYKGDGKWEYSASGNVSRTSTVPSRYAEKSPDQWVEEHLQKVVTYQLSLQAEYFEATDTLNILNIDRSEDVETVVKTSEVPIIAYKLKVNWIAGSSTGYGYRVEGSVKNIGILPLENALFVVNCYDGQGAFMGTENITLSPAKLAVGDSCKFVLDATGFVLHGSDPQKGKVSLGRFTYLFLLPSGKKIEIEAPD
jgi:hypothetical protein